jgi:excisionase family DNA binding protein
MPNKTGRMRFHTISEVAEKLCISKRHVWRAISDRDLLSHRFGRARRISDHDLEEYVRRSRDCAPDPDADSDT